MELFSFRIKILLLSFVIFLHCVTAQGRNYLVLHKQRQNATSSSSTYSPWLTRVKNPRATGCRLRPWICNQDFPRIRRRCCRNRCVDVRSDVNNCGLCGIRCRFSRQCCRGICVNTNLNPFHCGNCGHRCPFPGFCFFGMCNYAEPFPPFPFPPFPFPRPPKPFPPHKPHPPKGGWRPPPVG